MNKQDLRVQNTSSTHDSFSSTAKTKTLNKSRFRIYVIKQILDGQPFIATLMINTIYLIMSSGF